MNTISLRDPALREKLGLVTQSPETISKSYQSHRMPRPYRERGTLVGMVVDVVRTSDRPLSRLEICRALGYSKSPTCIAAINELVTDGVLSAACIDYHGRPKWTYQYIGGGS